MTETMRFQYESGDDDRDDQHFSFVVSKEFDCEGKTYQDVIENFASFLNAAWGYDAFELFMKNQQESVKNSKF